MTVTANPISNEEYEGLTTEDKKNAWTAVGLSLNAYWSKIDILLESAIQNATSEKVIGELVEMQKYASKAGAAFGVIFSAVDEFVLDQTDRSVEWSTIRVAVRALIGWGTAAGTAALVGGAAGFSVGGPFGAGVGIVSGIVASFVTDNAAVFILDSIENSFDLEFFAQEKIPEMYAIHAGYGHFVDVREGNTIHVNGGRKAPMVAAGSGNDTIHGSDQNSQEYGADNIDGGSGNDTIYGQRGNDVLYGGTGNDTIYGGDHDDEILGGNGTDTIYGGSGSDVIYGGEGDDVISGEGGSNYSDPTESDSDEIYGMVGDDKITVGVGDHLVFGGEGNDVLVGEESSGDFHGGAGDDKITVEGAESGQTHVFGDGGNDTIKVGKNVDQVDGGDGDDKIEVTDTDGNRMVITGGAGYDNIHGSSDGEDIYGNDDHDVLYGHEGKDNLYGGDSRDTLDGGDDTDIDRLMGGDGSDTYYAYSNDIIDDSDNSGKVFFNGILLNGGEIKKDSCDDDDEKNKSDDEDTIEGRKGEIYHRSNSGLTVEYNGQKLTIKSWRSNGDLGISFDPEGPEGGDSCDPSPDHYGSPLVLDMDGDGVELISLSDSVSFFDIDSDGIRERTGWVAADDALLALDKNGNGVIDDSNELFGYGETFSSGDDDTFSGPGGLNIRYGNGFDALAYYDSNNDGKIDKNDDIFSQLQIWQDANGDGVSDTEELKSLAEAGVTSLSLNSSPANEKNQENLVTDKGTYSGVNGEQELLDVWFKFNQYDIKYEAINNVGPAILALPNLSGGGRVRDLQTTCSEDPVLLELVERFANLSIDGVDQVSDLVDQILYRWAGTSVDLEPSSRGTHRGVFADARKISVIEAFADTEFRQHDSKSPLPKAGAVLTDQYAMIHRNMLARLMVQTDLGSELLPELQLRPPHFLILEAEVSSDVALQRLADNAPAGWAEKMAFYHAGLQLFDTVFLSFFDIKQLDNGKSAYKQKVEDILSSIGLDVQYDDFMVSNIGGNGDDNILMITTPGNQFGSENSIAIGGKGDDKIKLGSGQDYHSDSGVNSVYWGKNQGNDTILIGNGWDKHKVILPEVGFDECEFILNADGGGFRLTIKISATGETLTIVSDSLNVAKMNFLFEFDANFTKNIVDIIAENKTVTEGEDFLIQAKSEELDGLGGDDQLVGSDESSTYKFDLGYGHDTIFDRAAAGVINTVKFGTNVTLDDLEFSYLRAGVHNDLQIKISGTDDSLTIIRQMKGQYPIVDRFEFSNGTVLTYLDIVNLLHTEDGQIVGTGGNDTFHMNATEDTLYLGGDGADTYKYYAGEATHSITEELYSGTVDRIVFDSPRSQIEVTQDDDYYYFSIKDTSGKLAVQKQYSGIDYFRFSDNGADYNLKDLLRMLDTTGFDSGAIVGSDESETLNGTTGDDIIFGLLGNDNIYGGDGDDILYGGEGTDTLDGGSGDDTLIGDGGVSDFDGGEGNDLIIISDKRPSFFYDIGDGDDVILQERWVQTFSVSVHLGDNILPEDLTFSFVAFDSTAYKGKYSFIDTNWAMKIEVAGSGSMTFALDSFDSFSVFAAVNFSNASGADEIYFRDIIEELRNSSDEDQVIVGSFRSDEISSGKGNDVLAGGGGSDTFKFDAGDGHDTIDVSVNETYGLSGRGTISFGDGITASDLSFSRSGEQYQNLTITYSATDSVTIVNQYAVIANFVGVQSESYASTIKFSDGTKLDLSEVEADLMVSGYGDDTLIGSGGADTFAASAGNDVLQGLHGDDTYHFNSGAGEDLILENSANLRYQTSHVEFGELPVDTYREIDKLEFGADISFEDLEFEVVGENSTDLKIYIKNSSDSITIKDQLNPQENWGRLSEVNIDAINADELGPNGEISKAYWMKNLASSFGVEALFSSGIERFIFADGTEYTRQEFATKVGYTEQTSEGFIFTDENGGTLDGGAGEDVLEGGTGNDIIKFGEGYDNDVVSDDGGWDTIEFNGDVSFGEIVFSRSGDDGNDLLIELAGVARNSMLIKDQLADNGKEVELFKLANGTYFTNKDIETILLSQSITDTADTIVAFNGDDHIEARNGDDEIEARRGNDTVDGGAGTDTVILKGKKAEYTVTQDGTYTVVDGPSGTKKLINVEKLVFVDNDGNEEVSVLVANIAPEATTAQFTSLEDHNLVLFVSDLLSYVNDPDGANPELVSVSNAVNGSVVIDAGVVKFVPLQDFYGTAQFEYTIRDAGGLEATGSVQLTISAVNDQPVVASVLVDQSTPESVAWNYTVPAETFSDIDGDSLVLAASLEDGTPLPTWLTFDAVTQTLFGTPPQDFVGTLDIQITASDGTAEVSDTFELTVAATNDAPVVAVAQQDKSIAEDTEWTYTIPTGAFTDENDDTLTLTATLADGSDLPDWLLFFATTQTFSGLPPQDFTGTLDIKLTASDGASEVADIFQLSITATNDAPAVAVAQQDQSVSEDTAWSYTIPGSTFTDPDGDVLSYSAMQADGSALPFWLSFDASTQTFSGTPPQDFNGALTLKVTASDGAITVSDEFVLTVTATNDAPVVTVAQADQSVAENTTWTYTVSTGTFSDVDGDSLTMSASLANGSALPAWISFDASTQTFSGTPPQDFNGALALKVTASDGSVTASDEFALTVIAAQSLATAGDDILTGTTNVDVISGLGGADQINGGAGDDYLYGDEGDDTIYGDAGADTLSGGEGNDTLYVDADDISYSGGAGTDTIIFTQSSDVSYAVAQNGFENATGGAGNDTFWGSSATDNILIGGAGDDGLHGYGGNDTLIGGAGADYMIGGEGDDIVHVDQDDTWYSGGVGTDTIKYVGTGDFEYSLDQGHFEVVFSGAGNDALWGGDADEEFHGGAGNDELHGGAGNNTFYGDSGNDYIVSGVGDDTIRIEGSVFGHDSVDDFTAGAGSKDKFILDSDVFADFADVMSKAEDWGGSTTYITLDDDNSITLYGVQKSDLHVDDFQFV